MIYHTITAENPLIPRNSSNGMQTIRNMKLTLLSFQERFLNFRENMGISATSNHENVEALEAKMQAMREAQKIFATYD